MKFEAIITFGVIETSLRNIRMSVDATQVVLELIPARILDQPGDPGDEPNEAIRRLIRGAKPIVEADEYLKLRFDHILAIAIDTDIDVDLFGGLHKDWSEAPRLYGEKSFYPLLEVKDSPWKSQLPDFRGRDDPHIRHLRAISMECSFDILGNFPEGEWISSTPA